MCRQRTHTQGNKKRCVGLKLHLLLSKALEDQLLTIAVFILNDHVIIFCPSRIVAYHVGVMTKHCMGIDFPQSHLPGDRQKEEAHCCHYDINKYAILVIDPQAGDTERPALRPKGKGNILLNPFISYFSSLQNSRQLTAKIKHVTRKKTHKNQNL